MQSNPLIENIQDACVEINQQLNSCSLIPVWFVRVELAQRDDERVRESVANAVALEYGAYNRVAFESSAGLQFFCPQQNSKSGDIQTTIEMPSRILTFSIVKETDKLAVAIEAIRETHSYEEPVIYISEGMASRADYSADRDNPNRWWNRGFAI
ncbi:MAG: hypothetical protein OFPI_25170 [Osedax symbiont Rs2]|nr:MAG: hypothetical protein OFPI_25170 [Osedax symbiont Rs2]